MNLTRGMREQLVKEIRFAIEGMRKSTKLTDKIYYFSAVYGVLDRVYNFEFDSELIFIYQVVRQVFDTINAKLSVSTQREGALGTTLPNNLFDKLCISLDELAEKIEKDQNTHLVLQNISNIGYSTTGNGSYLYLKGVLKI